MNEYNLYEKILVFNEDNQNNKVSEFEIDAIDSNKVYV